MGRKLRRGEGAWLRLEGGGVVAVVAAFLFFRSCLLFFFSFVFDAGVNESRDFGVDTVSVGFNSHTVFGMSLRGCRLYNC